MNRYFIVPVTSKTIKVDGLSLLEWLQERDPELYEREMKRKSLAFGVVHSKKGLFQFDEETKKMYEEKGLPPEMLLASNLDGIKVLGTSSFIRVSQKHYDQMKGATIPELTAFSQKYPQYLDAVKNFFTPEKEEKKQFVKGSSDTI